MSLETRWDVAPQEVLELIRKVTGERFPALAKAKLLVLMDNQPRKSLGAFTYASINGRRNWSDLLASRLDLDTAYDYVLQIDRTAWEGMGSEQREFVIRHELSHCRVKFVADKPVFRIAGHDAEVFFWELENPDWRQFRASLAAAVSLAHEQAKKARGRKGETGEEGGDDTTPNMFAAMGAEGGEPDPDPGEGREHDGGAATGEAGEGESQEPAAGPKGKKTRLRKNRANLAAAQAGERDHCHSCGRPFKGERNLAPTACVACGELNCPDCFPEGVTEPCRACGEKARGREQPGETQEGREQAGFPDCEGCGAKGEGKFVCPHCHARVCGACAPKNPREACAVCARGEEEESEAGREAAA